MAHLSTYRLRGEPLDKTIFAGSLPCAAAYAAIYSPYIFPGSSAVERIPVKDTVAGSNPARGAWIEIEQVIARFLFYLSRSACLVGNRRSSFGA